MMEQITSLGETLVLNAVLKVVYLDPANLHLIIFNHSSTR